MGGEGREARDELDFDDESQAHRCNVLNGRQDSKSATSIGYPKVTSGQSNLTTGCIAVAHRWFSGISQVAPMCTPCNNASWANPSPNPKRHLDCFRRFCTAHGRTSLYFTMGCPSPSKLLLPMGGSGPHQSISDRPDTLPDANPTVSYCQTTIQQNKKIINY